ncbi:MAG: gliding motility lipoprotein GldH [Prevotellaceae bacterium]|jgi:gliding motility-associated lipoprotein GldH|nr:gliding motility lipoprotein GldH [Prevotellaceae bacterium]
MKSNNKVYILYLLFAIGYLFTACTTPATFEKIVKLNNDKWLKDSVINITLPITDTLGVYAIIVDLRNNNDYPFRNIHLFVDVVSPTGITVCDTVEYELSDMQGKWLGKRGSYWIDHRLSYRPTVIFPETGHYAFGIRHGMRADTLLGIGAVGLRLELIDIEK